MPQCREEEVDIGGNTGGGNNEFQCREEEVDVGTNIKNTNYINDGMPKIAISMDVKALYPSIKRKRAAAVVREAMENTTVKFENIDYRMALRYISKSSKPAEILDWGLRSWCPVRSFRRGARPGMTGDDPDDEKWTTGVVPTSEEIRRKILGRVLHIAVNKVFSSNAYTFAGVMRIQSDGCPIGLDLSGEIGRLEMGDWDGRMLELCASNMIKVDVSDRYVDDVDTILGAIPYGFRWVDNCIQFDPAWELEDENVPIDQHTVEVLTAMVNTIRPGIQMEGDWCSNYTDGAIPVLDLKLFTVLISEVIDTSKSVHRTNVHSPDTVYTGLMSNCNATNIGQLNINNINKCSEQRPTPVLSTLKSTGENKVDSGDIVSREVNYIDETSYDSAQINLIGETKTNKNKSNDLRDPPSLIQVHSAQVCESQKVVSYYQVAFKFYKKPVSRPTIINANTAMAAKVKRETTSNELMRRLLNTSRGLPGSEEDMRVAVNQFMVEMRDSGYGEGYRKDTLYNTMRGYRRKVEAADNGGIPLYREGHEGARERYLRKVSASSDWFKRKKIVTELEENSGRRPAKTSKRHPWSKGKKPVPRDDREVEGVIFIPHTSSSSLQKSLQERDDQITKALGMPRTRYVERGGVTLKDMLVNKNPWQQLNGGCGRQNCHLCNSQKGQGTSCRREGVLYKIECVLCERGEGHQTWYIGESSRSAHERLAEHFWLFANKKEGDPDKHEASSVLWRHSRDSHDGGMKIEDWKPSITSSHRTALGRQVAEAMAIAKGHPNVVLLNSKQEFGANNINELLVMKGGLILGKRNQKRGREGTRRRTPLDEAGEGEDVGVEEIQEEEVHSTSNPKRIKRDQDPPEGPNTCRGIKRYAHWTKAELEEECRRRRLPIQGGQEEIKGRLQKEDRTQPRLQFMPQGNKRDTGNGRDAQVGEEENEGGGERGDSGLEPSDDGEDQWEDVQTERGIQASGSEAKVTSTSPGRIKAMPGRTKPSPRRNRRGFWLGRRDKLLREASKKQEMN